MKATLLLQLAALTTAFVIPDEQVSNLQHVPVESQRHKAASTFDKLPSTAELLKEVENTFNHVSEEVSDVFGRASEQAKHKYAQLESESRHALDEAMSLVQDATEDTESRIHESYFDAKNWLETGLAKEIDMEEFDVDEWRNTLDVLESDEGPHHPPHHGPPGHDHPEHPPHDGPPHDGPPHPPYHPPHHRQRSNLTVYQLISTSNYTTKLAKWIDEFPDIVEALNGTEANFTIFAPSDRAFEKIPEHAPVPPKDVLKRILSYHISPKFYPAGRVLVTKTIPTLLVSEQLGNRPLPQRLSTNISPRGLTVNFYSRIVAVDIFGSNGVIHGVDSIILPPPEILKIIDLLPTEFSTLELGLGKTGLLEELNGTHAGGTFFAPSNFAFQKLGPRINAFLFSPYGQKYLKALLKYHVVQEGHTLYSDAYYSDDSGDEKLFKCKRDGDHEHHGPPKGFFHVNLPTMLDDKELSVDIARYGRLIDIRINGFSHVTISDGVAKDGVIHVVGDVLIPPKKLGEAVMAGDEMTVEELKERLEPFVEKEEKSWFDL